MKFKNRYLLIFFLIALVASVVLLFKHNLKKTGAVTAKQTNNSSEGKALFIQNCGRCHLTPAPERLTKDIWRTRVLPMMAIKMGLEDEDYERNISEEERRIEKEHNIVPEHPMISRNDFNKISDYILSHAPDSIRYAAERLGRNKSLTRFTRQNISLDKNVPSLITSLQFDSTTKSLWIGNYYNEVQNWKWKKGLQQIMQVQSPVVHFYFYQGNIFLTQIGDLMPSELSKGVFSYVKGNQDAVILKSLHRPVHTDVEDLNGDSIPEILVCNFGKNVGSLAIYHNATANGSFTKQKLLPTPGATKTFIRDMNGDGKKDIVALIAQADETIYIFYNKGNLEFEKKAVLHFPPDYGTTDMELFDFNKDGLLDIVTAHGDNADYSIILKPYHGIRLHINEGKNNFTERFFYPIYGVTKVLAEDFDKDGDIDFAASAFYPDYGALLDESFVYLENKNSSTFTFQSYISKADFPVRSLSLEKGDIDGDGDMDIILGLFAFSPVAAPPDLEKKWATVSNRIILFRNNLY